MITDEARQAILDDIWAAFVLRVPRYTTHGGSELEHDVRVASSAAISSFERLIAGEPVTRAMRAIDFNATVSQRLGQGFVLQELLGAARIECSIIWKHMASRLDPATLPDVGAKMLELLDVTCSELERRYDLELERLRDSREESVELFFRRITSAEPLSAMEGDEARLLGHDIDLMQTGSVIAPRSAGETSTSDHASLKELARTVRGKLPMSLVTVLDGQLLLAYPKTLDIPLSDLLTKEIRRRPTLSAGVGGAYPGTFGLRRSLAEAARARSIAGIMYPGREIAVYADLRVFDIFSEGETIDAFVEEVLGPLVRHDRAKGAQLVRTLATFYDTGMNRKSTASRLSIHANTLDYRLRQVESILPAYVQGGPLDFRLPLALKLLPTMQRPLTGSAEPGGD